MSVTEIKTSIAQLPPADLADLTAWFEEFQADAWDRQIANDVKAGRFEAVLRRVDEQAEQQLERARFIAALQEGEQAICEGRTRPAEEVFDALKDKQGF